MNSKGSSIILQILEKVLVLLKKLLKKPKKIKEEVSQSTQQSYQASYLPSQSLSSLLKPLEVEFPYQTDERFSEDINKWGCALLCIAKIAWNERGFKANSTEEIIDVIMKAKQVGINVGYLDEELTILDYNKVFLLFGLIVMYTDSHEPVYVICGSNEREMLYMEYLNVGHFVVGDGLSKVVWDPYSKEGSKTAKYGRVVSKRIFEIKGWSV